MGVPTRTWAEREDALGNTARALPRARLPVPNALGVAARALARLRRYLFALGVPARASGGLPPVAPRDSRSCDVAACADKVAMLFGFTGAAVDDSAGASCLEVRARRAHICHFVCSGSIFLSGESHFLAGEDFHYNGNLRLNGTAIPHSVLSTCTRNDC